jgi:hypothetical protein
MPYLEDNRVILSKGSIDKTGARIYGKKANVPELYVVELQKHLSELGFGPGAADGFFGTRTDEALRAFQEASLESLRIKDGKAITVSPSYTGGVNGECDRDTREEIQMRQYPIGTAEHCDRFVKWFNDAVTVLGDHSKRPSVPYDVYLA